MHLLKLINLPLHITDLHLQILKMNLVGNSNIRIPNSSRVNHILTTISFFVISSTRQMFIDIGIQFLWVIQGVLWYCWLLYGRNCFHLLCSLYDDLGVGFINRDARLLVGALVGMLLLDVENYLNILYFLAWSDSVGLSLKYCYEWKVFVFFLGLFGRLGWDGDRNWSSLYLHNQKNKPAWTSTRNNWKRSGFGT